MARGKYHEWLTPDGLLRLEAWARDGLTDEQIAKNCGIAYSTLRAWRDKHPALEQEKQANIAAQAAAFGAFPIADNDDETA